MKTKTKNGRGEEKEGKKKMKEATKKKQDTDFFLLYREYSELKKPSIS